MVPMGMSLRNKLSTVNRLVEFHSHSTHSDGANTPRQLAQIVFDSGVEIWALTDHDTCSGVREAQDAATELGIQCVAGIEVSAFAERSIHVLGLGINPTTLSDFSVQRGAMRRLRMEEMVSNLNRQGVAIQVEEVFELAAGASVGRPHLARILVGRGVVSTVSEAFERLIGSQCPAYVETTWPSVIEAIQLIHAAEGIAVVAHPGKDDVTLDEVKLWRHAGLDGLEILHPRHDPKQAKYFEVIADSLEMFKLASTDYHSSGPNDLKPGVEMPRRWLEPVINRLGLK